jgi:signal transduction histidine kinase/ActR/RegA family two-component response regulator
MLERDGFACSVVASLASLTAQLQEGAGVAVIAEEAVRGPERDLLVAHLHAQEPWSDFPLVILVSTRVVTTNQASLHLDGLGNVVLLERPVNVATLHTAVRSALRGRQRQYHARAVLIDRAQSAARLQQSEAALLALNETLESKIEERTRALAEANDRLTNEGIKRERAQQALLEYQKMEAIGQLTGGLAHDFNNLLHVVQGNMDLIMKLSRDDTAIKRAEVARRACERGAKLTAQLLAFSRKQRLDLRAVNVQAMLDGVRELLSTSIGSRIDLQFDIAEDAGLVMADKNQLEMALLNLAINARDAMAGGGRLRISATSNPPPADSLPSGNYCCIAVSDTGSGIAPENLGKVFEPFFTTKGVGKGTGLGLSQVYGMTQQSGGTAKVSSIPGQGTVVEMWLRSAEFHDAVQPAEQSSDVPHQHPGAKILVVEDDSAVRNLMVESLEVLGYVVSQAADAESGLFELRQQAPDVIITDYLMPNMTGAELVERVADLYPGLPVVIATGYADMRAIEVVLGTSTILKKPFHLADLAASVERALRNSTLH